MLECRTDSSGSEYRPVTYLVNTTMKLQDTIKSDEFLDEVEACLLSKRQAAPGLAM